MTYRNKFPVAAAVGLFLLASDASASQASTHFSIFVPPNDSNNGRHSTLIVTATSDDTTVSILDTDEDGDSDDSTSATLSRGQSIVVRIRDGAVNDGAGGVWDGDRFVIDADRPVTAMLSTRSDWQHDWVPSENSTMRGQEFFMWTPLNNWDVDVVAYEDDTTVEVYEVSTSAQNSSGTTSVELPGNLLLRQDLNAGQNLLTTLNRAGTNITRAGHTYRVVTSQPVTVMYGAFRQRNRDGGGQVPSEQGTTVGEHFYFAVPAEDWAQHEREIRIVAGNIAAEVTLRGWTFDDGWVDLDIANLTPYGHLDYTGRSHTSVRDHELFEVIADNPVTVFEANWLETGNFGTSDIWSWVSALDAGPTPSDVGQEFVAYIGPPGRENNAAGFGGLFSHLYIATLLGSTEVTVTDVDTAGGIINEVLQLENADDVADFRITVEQYNQLNQPDSGVRPYVRVQATADVSVATTNWNDNWLSFAGGTVPDALRVNVIGDEQIPCDTSTEFDINVENVGSTTVTSVNVTVEPVGDTTLLTAPTTIATLAPGETDTQTISASVSCSDGASAPLAGITAVATSENGETGLVAASGTNSAPVTEPEVPRVTTVNATPDACAVEVNWWTDADDASATYEVLRRDFGNTGPFSLLGTVPSLGTTESGFFYSFRDTTASATSSHQYAVRAIDPSDVEYSFAGPTIGAAGEPLVDAPDATGDIFEDFAEIGTIITDPSADVGSKDGTPVGLDADAIAVAYDPVYDVLFLGLSTTGVVGDLDGDGDANTDSDPRDGLIDRPDWAEDESFAFLVDLDGDGTGDMVVGTPFGGDISLLQSAPANQGIGISAPVLAFDTPSTTQTQLGRVEVLNNPRPGAPDLELRILNPSAYLEGEIGDIQVAVQMVAPSYSPDSERVPDNSFANPGPEAIATSSCGIPADQFHMSTFAVFGNVFTGTPSFDFLPFGWNDTDTGETLAAPPAPVPGEIITSPTVFLPQQEVTLEGTLNPAGLALSEQDMSIHDVGFILPDGDFVHRSQIDWNFAASEGTQRYENLDLQVFRMFVLDCSATIRIEQHGTSGVLRDDRFVLLADDTVAAIGPINPALTLAHSGVGTFEVGGEMQRLFFGAPEDWVTDFGPTTAPNFTQYAFLDDVTYLGSDTPDTTSVFPLGEDGAELEAGIWFINHYVWTYANEGTSLVETTLTPGPDCGETL